MATKKISHADKRNAAPEEQLPLIEDGIEAPHKPVTPEQIARVVELARAQAKLENKIDRLQSELKALGSELDFSKTVLLPKAMDEAGMSTCPLNGGYRVDIENVVRASIPSPSSKKVENAQEKNAIAIGYMDTHGPDMVDTVLIERYPRGTEKELKKRIAENKRRKHPVEWEVTRTVHTGALSAWVRKRDAAGIATDSDVLNIQRVKVAEIIAPKKKKEGVL